MEIAILLLECVIILILFILGQEIVKKPLQNQNSNFLQENSNDEEIHIFQEGSQHTWIAVSVSLYKMWNDLEILDFDNIQEKLQSTINQLTSNPSEFEKWHKKFNLYLKEKHNGPDNSI